MGGDFLSAFTTLCIEVPMRRLRERLRLKYETGLSHRAIA